MLTTTPTKNWLMCQVVGCILYTTNQISILVLSVVTPWSPVFAEDFFFFTNVVGAITSGKAGRYSNCQMQQSREEITLGGFTSKLWDCNSWCLRRDNLRIRPGWVIACWGSQYCWWGKGILEKGTPSHAKGMCETSKGFWCLSFCAPRPAFYIPQEKPRILWDRRII